MSGKELIYHFLAGEKTGRVPFMPIFMRFAAAYGKVNYRDFVRRVEDHCRANLQTARDFESVWVNVMSDPYCEMDAYGAPIVYPEHDLPMFEGAFIAEIDELSQLGPLDFDANYRTKGRIEQCARFRELGGNDFLVCGWVEGPLAEYCDLRTMGNAFLDLYDEPEKVKQAMTVILENARNFITAQVQAGADCIGIGDAACSQVGRELYLEFAFEGEKMLIDHIHSLGALAKLHICGDTTAILPEMIATGADIIDIDHLVKDMSPFVHLLGHRQAFCGNIDPVSVIQNGSKEQIQKAVKAALKQAPGKLIVSGGCEITPATRPEQLYTIIECL